MIKSQSLLLIIAQLLNAYVTGQIVDIPPNGRQNYRARQGGSIKVNLDKTIPLAHLINKLDSNWEFVETGKAYWIGYTNDMYSIASHSDSAITPLIDHFKSTKSKSGKLGAIYCLHLIGINSKIVGRFTEKFENKKARDALVTLAKNKEYTGIIVSLLGRNPWESDLPVLIELLKENNSSMELINALFRYTAIPYHENDLPFRQTISENSDTINVFLQDSVDVFKVGTLMNLSDEEALRRERNVFMPGVVVQFGYGGKRTFRKFTINTKEIKKITSFFNCPPIELNKGICNDLDNLLYQLITLSWEKISPFSYSDYWDIFQHSIENNNLIIYTPEQSSKKWLEYFKKKK